MLQATLDEVHLDDVQLSVRAIASLADAAERRVVAVSFLTAGASQHFVRVSGRRGVDHVALHAAKRGFSLVRNRG